MVATTEEAKENGGPQVRQTRPIYSSISESALLVLACINELRWDPGHNSSPMATMVTT